MTTLPYANFSWKTREGIKLTWGEMDVGHLANAISHLRKKVKEAEEEMEAAAGYSGTGEEACACADQASTAAWEKAMLLSACADCMQEHLDARLGVL